MFFPLGCGEWPEVGGWERFALDEDPFGCCFDGFEVLVFLERFDVGCSVLACGIAEPMRSLFGVIGVVCGDVAEEGCGCGCVSAASFDALRRVFENVVERRVSDRSVCVGQVPLEVCLCGVG